MDEEGRELLRVRLRVKGAGVSSDHAVHHEVPFLLHALHKAAALLKEPERELPLRRLH